jgi:hypothetical protein
MKPARSTAQHLLLLHQPNGPAPAPGDLAKIMARFGAWMTELQEKGLVAGTNGLDHTGKVVRKAEDEAVVTDGPYAEATEVVGGYVLLNVADLNEAVAIAKKCPGLDYRMAVEVRPVINRG